MDSIQILETPFSPLQAMAAFETSYLAGQTNYGATVSFTGTMRDFNENDDVTGMYLEHYAPMANQQLKDVINEARKQWEFMHCLLIHRVGEIRPGDPIVLVVTWSEHRAAAFSSARFIMDKLKSTAPFWKKETLKDGSERWVEKNTIDPDA